MLTGGQLKLLHEDFSAVVGDCGADNFQIFASKKVIVTGACGFLGRYIVDFLSYLNDQVLKGPCAIIAIDNGLVSDWARFAHLEADPNVALLQADICEGELPRADYILNAASIASPLLYKKFPLETARVNALGVMNILGQSPKALGIVHFSSSEVYGVVDDAHIPTREDYFGNVSCNGPRSPYDESKRFAETICAIYWRIAGAPIKIIRPFNVYGPGMNLTDGRIIPTLIDSVLGNTPFKIFGTGTATRTYTYASDFLTQLMMVLIRGQNGETYNVGDDRQEISVKALSELAQRMWDGKPLVTFIDPGVELVDATTRRVPDLTNIQALGYSPKMGLQGGLYRTRQFHAEDE